VSALTCFVTFGSNSSFFVLAYDPIECITFPPTTLLDELKAKAVWLNTYEKDTSSAGRSRS